MLHLSFGGPKAFGSKTPRLPVFGQAVLGAVAPLVALHLVDDGFHIRPAEDAPTVTGIPTIGGAP